LVDASLETLLLCCASQLLHYYAFIIFPATQRIKENLVPHSFFSALQGASDDCSFISWLERGV
jgi:hypothetical protein